MKQATLYLIPVTLGDSAIDKVIPKYNLEIILNIKHFIVENLRSARRFLKKCDPSINIEELTFYELNKHTNRDTIGNYLNAMSKGESIGIISESGCPAIADPGADVVEIAQRRGYKVTPLVGPSSILMSLMASGFNGQSFAFHGYLPIDNGEKIRRIKQLENRSYSENQTHIFIETPYRNQKLAEDLISHCKPQTKMCIAMNVSLDNEYIVTKTMKEWKGKLPEMHKQLCVFLIHKG
ncbi:MAG: SAM-dependent methyltransferase [Proteiniphilum sp.]|nr:SAM-dependent methyltransferase [Proteiniphilum sp.]